MFLHAKTATGKVGVQGSPLNEMFFFYVEQMFSYGNVDLPNILGQNNSAPEIFGARHRVKPMAPRGGVILPSKHLYTYILVI